MLSFHSKWPVPKTLAFANNVYLQFRGSISRKYICSTAGLSTLAFTKLWLLTDAAASFETQRTLPGPWSYWQNACPCVCRSCVPAFLIVEYRNHCENLRPYTWLCHLAFFIDSSLCTVSRSAGKYFTFITFLKILGFFFSRITWIGQSYPG